MKLVYRLAVAALLATGSAAAAEAPPAPAPVVAPVPVADAAPDVVVRALYESYFAVLNATHDDPNTGTDWMTASKPYMTPDLAARIAKYETSGDGGIDIDMLMAAQDWSLLKVENVTVTASDPATATVRVDFTDTFGSEIAKSASDVKLARLPEGWRIADIVTHPGTPEEWALTKNLTELGL